jgi:hypothetical protein
MANLKKNQSSEKELSFEEFKASVLNDFKIANISREASLLGRKEVLTGKAKFGIFGDGKELPQLAMARVFKMEILEAAITAIKPSCLLPIT